VSRPPSGLSRIGPPLAVLLLAGPVAFGLLGTLAPSFGYLPALGGDTFTLDPYRKLMAQPAIGRSMLTSLAAGLGSALLSVLVVALFLAAWSGTRTFARLQHLLSPLLAVPHAAAAFGLAFLIAPSGMIARLISPELTGWIRPPDLLVVNDPLGLSLIAGLVVKEIPFLLLVALATLGQVQPARSRMLAASLGYGRVMGFLLLVWPLIYARIRLAVFAVVAFASSVVDVAAILGPTTPPVLAVRLVGWMNDPELSMRFLASAGAMAQLGLTLGALAIWLGLERIGRAGMLLLGRAGVRLRHDDMLRRLALVLMLAAGMSVFAGLALLGLWSVAGLWQFPASLPATLTSRTWEQAAPAMVRPLATTLVVALGSTAAAVAIVLLCLRREDRVGRRAPRLGEFVIYLPLIVPQIAFLFGFQLLFLLTGVGAGLAALVLAHLVFVTPYVFLSLSGLWRSYDRRYEAVSAGLGRSGLSTLLRVKLPMLAAPLATAAAVGFAVSIGLYLPTLLIGAGRLTTVTTEAVALASGANRRVIGAYAFLQMTLPVIGFLAAMLVPALLFRRRRAMRVDR
jgi:putative thiamine transport system permease protein